MMVFEQKREARMRQRRKQVTDECLLLMFLISLASGLGCRKQAPPNERKSHECLNLKGAHVPDGSCHMCSEAVRRRLHRRRIIAATTIAVYQTWGWGTRGT